MSNSTTNSTADWHLLRPFGSLPDAADEPFDKGILTAAVITGTLALLHVAAIIMALVRKRDIRGAQQNNLLLVLFSQVAILFGLLGTIFASDAYTQIPPTAPKSQPLYAQAFTFICFAGQALLFLPALFVSRIVPLPSALRETFRENKMITWKRFMIGVTVTAALVLISLEIAVLALASEGDYNRPVLITLFSFEAFVVVVMLSLGVLSLIGAYMKREKNKDKKTDDEPEIENITRRMVLIVLGSAFVAGYLVVLSIESPNAYVLRVMEIVHLFALVVFAWVFTASLGKSVTYLLAKAKVESGRGFDGTFNYGE